MSLFEMLHDGSPWLLLVELMLFAGVVIGLFTRRGSGISSHPYTKPASGGQLASDLPPESLGRTELEPRLWPRRHHPRRRTDATPPREAPDRGHGGAGAHPPPGAGALCHLMSMNRIPLLPLFTVAVAVAVALIVLLLLTASWWVLAIAFGALLAMLALVFNVIRANVNDQP